MSEMVKAAVFMGPHTPFDIREFPVTATPSGYGRSRLIASGVCGTDLHFWRGTLAVGAPSIVGHEFVGRLEDCDEAEKLMIGKCAFKAYSATNLVCTILAIVLAVCALVFDIGFLPSLTVCLVWIVNLSVYCKEAMRYSKVGSKIS